MDHPKTHRRKFISGRKHKGKLEEKNQKEVVSPIWSPMFLTDLSINAYINKSL
jgi:hypothetical protein